jgi:predicted ATPase
MKLDHIEISGFKSLRSLTLDLRSLNVLIGANGAGKSNFIGLFEILNQMIQENFQIYVGQNGGANSFLYFGEKTTDHIEVYLVFGANRYRCVWVPTVDDSLIFKSERAYYQGPGYDSPYIEPLGSGHKESQLPRFVREHKTVKVPDYVLRSLRTWKVYHFHDTSESALLKKIGDINDNESLRSDARNLAAFLHILAETAPKNYKLIRDTIRMVAPFFDDFLLRPMPSNEDKIRLEWREQGSDYPFLAHHLSDGTLRFMCLATLLLQPKLPSTIVIDEPELGLHPYAINVLASIMRSVSKKTQLIVSTQSVPLVNQFQPEDLLVVDRENHATEIRRLDGGQLAGWLENYSLGELWEKNVLGGRPS